MDWFGDTFFIISTHAPLAGRDRSPTLATGSSRIFQPTRPLRGATTRHIQRFARTLYFNPRAPCGARQRMMTLMVSSSRFQPTRPLRGATSIGYAWKFVSTYFNPRAPCGARRTSLHRRACPKYFNPRAPCGARQQKCTNHYAHFCDNRQISDAFAQNAACQGILLLFDAGKPCGFWVRTAQVISAHLCFAL